MSDHRPSSLTGVGVLDPLSHALGRIEQALETITKTLSEDRLASAAYRTEVRRDITVVSEMVGQLRAKVDSNAEDLAEIRPDINDWRVTKGAFSLAANGARVAWAVLGAAAAGLIAWFTHKS